MLLEEAGYDQVSHDERIKAIRARMPLELSEVIQLLVEVYLDLYGVDDDEINHGMCEDFAYDLKVIMGEGEVLWADEMPGGNWDEHGAHAFFKYRGRFYDSEAPDGVTDWTHLSFFD